MPTAADRLTMVRRGVEERGWVPIQNYLMPPVGAPAYMLDGAKTVGFELAEQLDWRVPDVVVAPTSNGDLPVGVWRAFLELRELGWVDRVPRMIAAEVYGALANALAKGLDHTEAMPTWPTVAFSAGNPISAYQSLHMLRETGGTALGATDDEIMAAQLLLARTEGCGRGGLRAHAGDDRPTRRQRPDRPRRGGRRAAHLRGPKDPDATLRYLPSMPRIEPTFEASTASWLTPPPLPRHPARDTPSQLLAGEFEPQGS